jgi:hypothetical protein
VSVLRDEWEERDARLDTWAVPRDRSLDRRLGRLGYLPSSGYHVDGCAVGVVPGAPCNCRQVVARQARRRRGSRAGLLSR